MEAQEVDKKVFLSLIIPSYNEENAIPVVLSEVLDFKKQLVAHNDFSGLEVIVVDDGSTDRSHEILKTYSWINLLKLDENSGYGAAIKKGIEAAGGDVIAFMDMDATYHVSDILEFAQELKSNQVDMIVGDRQLDRIAMPAVRRVGNWFFSSFASLVSAHKIKDCCSGIRVVRAELMREALPKLPNTLDFALALTLFVIRNQKPFKELPTIFKKRVGSSKLSEVYDGLRFLFCILNSRRVYRSKKF